MDRIWRVAKAAFNEAVKPESFVKGDEFESYIRNEMYLQEDYDLIHRTHDYTANKGDYITTTKEPDFKFKSHKNGKEFYVEAKYRSAFYKQAIEWCKPFQLKRYREIDKKTPVWVVIGVGGSPDDPTHVYEIPLKEIKYPKLFLSFLNKYEI